MFKRNRVSVLAMLAFFSLLPFTACNDDIVSGPFQLIAESSSSESGAVESSAQESSSDVVSSSSEILLLESSSSSEPLPLSSSSSIKSLIPESSSATPESSSSVKSPIDRVCNDENEGEVDSLWTGNDGNPRFRFVGTEEYYRCEKGSWIHGDKWLACDTTGLTPGAVCSKTEWMAGLGSTEYFYTYEGGGIWSTLGTLSDVPGGIMDRNRLVVPKECSAENEGSLEKMTLGNETGNVVILFKCVSGTWNRVTNVDSGENAP
jgi:hypothetical protein